ncbi:MAG: carboxypeptidase regulatory-like domain-containing protein [Bacteroidales bacterium]
MEIFRKPDIKYYRIYLIISGLLVSGILYSCDRFNFFPRRTYIEGIVLDGISFEKLSGATVILKPSQDSSASTTGQVTIDENGEYKFEEVTLGNYNLSIKPAGYKEINADNISLDDQYAFIALLPVSNEINVNTGGITGRVTDKQGDPLSEVNVAISGQDMALTNGFFTSTVTDEKGHFFIGAVPVDKTNEFKIRFADESVETLIIDKKIIPANGIIHLHAEMQDESIPSIIFYDGFENNQNNWERSGFWGIQQNAAVYNKAFPKYVQIAPNDHSNAKIPDAFRGEYMAWFGQESKGNYMGQQSPYDLELSGGTGTQANRGELISPWINLRQLQQASVSFWSWFEIESATCHPYGFDLMEIYIIQDDTNSEIFLGSLNPDITQLLDERDALPQTSGGFNQAPVWRFDEFDLGSFTGSEIRLKFVFNTRDHKHNGFRGWFIDEIKVVEREAQINFSADLPQPVAR